MLIFHSSLGLAEFRVNDRDSARESSDSSVSSVQHIEKSPKAHYRVEARSKTQQLRVIDIVVSYRPLLSFVADLYFGGLLLHSAPAKVESVSSYH